MTTERLALALEAANAPKAMVVAARAGCYDDFKSESASPISDLVRDLYAAAREADITTRSLLLRLAQRAKLGEFDATREEADAWAASQTGEMAMLLRDMDPRRS